MCFLITAFVVASFHLRPAPIGANLELAANSTAAMLLLLAPILSKTLFLPTFLRPLLIESNISPCEISPAATTAPRLLFSPPLRPHLCRRGLLALEGGGAPRRAARLAKPGPPSPLLLLLFLLPSKAEPKPRLLGPRTLPREELEGALGWRELRNRIWKRDGAILFGPSSGAWKCDGSPSLARSLALCCLRSLTVRPSSCQFTASHPCGAQLAPPTSLCALLCSCLFLAPFS